MSVHKWKNVSMYESYFKILLRVIRYIFTDVSVEQSSFICPEDGDSTFLRNIGKDIPDYKAWHLPKILISVVTAMRTSILILERNFIVLILNTKHLFHSNADLRFSGPWNIIWRVYCGTRWETATLTVYSEFA
jgi:hypothetical protein